MIITGNAKVFGIIGNPVSHSLSPVFWNAAFSAARIDAVYVPFLVERGQLKTAIEGIKSLSISGFNVTKPYKEEVSEYISEFHSSAEALRSVNTVKTGKQGKLVGYNTDAKAFLSIFQEVAPVPRKVLLLGAGGAAKSILWSLGQTGVEMVYWANRTRDRLNFSMKLGYRLLPISWSEEDLGKAIQDSSVVVNATALGWSADDDLPVLGTALSPEKTYIDLNYGANSRLIRSARSARAKVIDGLEFLVRQGMEAFEILAEMPAPEKIMRESLVETCNGKNKEGWAS